MKILDSGYNTKMAVTRGIIVGLGLIAQILLSCAIYLFFIEHITIINVLFSLAGFLLILALIKYSKNYSYTLPWIIILIMFPLVGTLLYIVIGSNKKRSKVLKSIIKSENESKKYFVQDEKIKEELKDNSKARYLCDFCGFPATKNNDVVYYKIGEDGFEAMLEELKKAEKFIFLEYFIINHGTMWGSILEVLEEKAKSGVEVRVMYDDLGCMSTLKKSYPLELEKKGIKCIAFNRLNPVAGVIMNNRDHRKILVIDGKVAFSGGINISDEYINAMKLNGHWKDNAIKISGDAVWSYTVMFLTMWNAFKKEDGDYNKFKHEFLEKDSDNGYVIPYSETPLDDEPVGENIYLNIINQANNYVYIFTPYLIIDTDMINSLTLAAKRGVDVRVVVPGVPDKKVVYTLTESYIEPLVRGGVKVYKYTPGFVHAKVFVSDDKIATVGTINLDYRSLYLHFECGVYLENVKVIDDIKNDLIDTIEKSHEVSNKEVSFGLIKGIWQALLRLAAPLM